MPDFLTNLFDASRFVPLRHCGAWTEGLIGVHVGSDLLTGIAELAIAAVLVTLAFPRRSLAFSRLFWMFGVFITACGLTHLLAAAVFAWPAYRLLGLVKLLTAGASWATVAALVPMALKGLAPLRGREELQREIEERKRVEAILTRQARLLDVTHDSIIVRGMDGTITFWNQGAETRYGWTRAEAIGRNCQTLLQTRFPAPLAEIEAALIRDGKWEGELEKTRRDGRRLVVASRWVLVRDEQGRPLSILDTNHDVTERRRVEARFQGLLESAPDAMVIVDPGGRIALVNSRTESLFGYDRQELLGREVELLIPERFRAGHPAHRAGFSAAPRTRPMGEGRDLFGLRKDGTEVAVEISLSPVEIEGEILVYSAVRDVTEGRRVKETLRRRTAQLEAANAELEAFSYSVSHDLRAPLRAIDGFSRILQEDYAAALPQEARDDLQSVRDNTRQMGRLIDDLLAFARLGRQAIRKQPVDSDRIVRLCLGELRGEQQERAVEVSIGSLSPCDAEPSLLKQVWFNLLSNALKYTRGREPATIEVGCSAGSEETGPPVYFVKDNGVGFDMRYADKLFGVFQRLHRAEDYEGTGVGLAIVQRIVQRHGGRVWAEAQPGEGATFSFTLNEEGARE